MRRLIVSTDIVGTRVARTISLGILLAAGMAASALAADRPVLKAPRPAPVAPVLPIPTWTGAYAGINVGGGFGVNSDRQSATFSAPLFGDNGLLSGADKHASKGLLAGVQIGYNWQPSSAWLLGLEADWQWTSQKNSSAVCTPPATPAFFNLGANGFGYCLADDSRLRNLTTVRARTGMLVRDTLWYATGGVAWASVKDSFSFNGSANGIIFPPALQPGPFFSGGASFSTLKTGWTVGAGVETQLDSRWSAKLEYLYVDLGTVNESFAIAINPAFGPPVTAGSAIASRSSHITDNVVRAGLNYKLF